MTKGINIKKLEADLWESADLLRVGSKLTSDQASDFAAQECALSS